MAKNIKIGLFGFGVVGQGLLSVLNASKSIDAEIVKVCVKSKDKERNIPQELITFDPNDILNDSSINLVVELIDNADDAYQFVKTALLNGKNVVSASKKMLATHLAELIEIQKNSNVSLLYEASACGSIPIIRNLEEYYDNDLLQSVSGILNGSSNYILSKIFNEKGSYSESLKKAQELGFAESNPYFDVEGFDSLYKLIIITLHGFGVLVRSEDVFVYGISNISEHDINYAREKGYKIKLVGQVRYLDGNRISLFVCPRLVTPDKYIYNVENQFNGVVLQGLFYDKQFMFGQGAGGHPTGSAVLSDITAQFHDYKYEYKKLNQAVIPTYTTDVAIEVYLRYDSEATLDLLQFESISERYTSENYKYIIGRTKLTKLVAIADVLRTKDVFLAYTGSAI